MLTGLLATLAIFGTAASNQQIERWTVREAARIGSVDEPSQSLTRVGDVLTHADSVLFIAQPADQTIRVYDWAGRFVRSIGRAGEGPAEFKSLRSIGLLGDTLYATDHALRRVSRFAPDGTLIRTDNLATPFTPGVSHTPFAPTVPTMLLEDGTGLVWPSVSVAWLAAGNDRVPLFRMFMDRTKPDTIAIVEHEIPNAVVIHQGRRVGVSKPFPDWPLYAFLKDGSGVLVVRRRAAASSRRANFQVVKINLAGDTVFVRDFPYDPLPIRQTAISVAISEIHSQLASRHPGLSEREIITALRDGGHLPRFHPPVTEVASGTDGTIWIRREAIGDRAIWHVLSPDGAARATVELGRHQSVRAATGTTLIVVEHDELDVPYVVRYRVEK